MNLREETIKVLREFVESFRITICDNLYKDVSITLERPHALVVRVPVSGGKSWIFADLEVRRRAALSRLEAGSGEETGEPRKAKKGDRGVVETPAGDLIVVEVLPQLKVVRNQDAPILKRPDEDPAVYAELLAGAHAENAALLNQEGGDAPETAGRNASSKVGGDVATPAPGENSERAEANPAWVQTAEAFAARWTLIYREKVAAEVAQLLQAAEDYGHEKGFTAGRRSMREEAAKVAESTSPLELSPEAGVHTISSRPQGSPKIAAAIRAIPEKQS